MQPSLRALLPAAFLFLACSSKESVPFDGGVQPQGDGGVTTPANATWCSDPPPDKCSGVNVCGACAPNPPGDLVRTQDAKEYTGSGPVDMGCFTDPGKLDPTKSKTVTMQGLVKIFANGPDSKNVKIEVYKEKLDASGKPQGELGELVATGFSDEALGTVTETVMKSGMPIERILVKYKIDNVPTETPLVIKTSAKSSADLWFPLYDWNVVAYNSKLAMDGTFAFDCRALSGDDYTSIMKAAYGRPPEPGRSAIAGEVHDCGDVRLSNATVAVAPKSPLGLVYLSEVEDDPLPDSSRKGTGKLGLYAVGGLTPGVFTVGAAGNIGGSVVALGSYKVRTFEDSVSVFTFRGLRPWQK